MHVKVRHTDLKFGQLFKHANSCLMQQMNVCMARYIYMQRGYIVLYSHWEVFELYIDTHLHHECRGIGFNVVIRSYA